MVYNMGYSREKHGISLAKTMGYLKRKLWYIIWDIVVKSMGYL